ncbi:hypothetical protein DINM_020019 [Dirofilaria immitis]|nr:hypothetical protein [Dirofilaria immitis]
MYYHNYNDENIFPYCAYELFNSQMLYRKSQNESVSVRYQLRENVSTSKLLVPLVTVITAFVLISSLPHIMLPSRQTDNYWVFVDQLIIYCFYAEMQDPKETEATAVLTKRNRRQFYGGHGFGSLSVGPFFQYAWGNTHNGWYGPGLYGYGWNSFRPPFVIRRRFWRRRWQNLDGLHESFGGHEFSDNFGHAFLP